MSERPAAAPASTAPPIRVVWFKRDLRVADHPPLTAALSQPDAASRRPVIALYAFEPSLLAAPETDRGHLAFICASLAELQAELSHLGIPLVIVHAEVAEVLDRLHARVPIEELHSHEETGLEVTWARDRAVAAWCARTGVTWREHRAFGVIRGLRNRDGWGSRWNPFMSEPPAPVPTPQPPVPGPVWQAVAQVVDFAAGHGGTGAPGGLGAGGALGVTEAVGARGALGVFAGPGSTGSLTGSPTLAALPALLLPNRPDRPGAQSGGRAAGLRLLDSFFAERSVDYRRALASPKAAWTGGSRFSPHLAWGTLSLREVHHATVARRRELAVGASVDPRWIASLDSFAKRLRWHCHFIQKLESEPEIEFRNMNRAFDGMRLEDEGEWGPFEHARLEAWAAGRTGFPMVDAGMRCLAETGWINFRVRAMLVSFATQHLWLHWRPVARELARRFVDFEPGIHISQCQMQAGVTGINALRIYSPAKQVLDNDPRGAFIREWVPELRNVPDDWLAHPEQMPRGLRERAGATDYPDPIVDHREAMRHARAEHGKVRRSAAARDENLRVYRRHGSRKGGRRQSLAKRKADSGQLELGL